MKYVPSKKVPSDDLIIIDEDGEEQQPHVGEWVRFRRHLPLAAVRLMWEALPLEDLEPEERVRLRLDRGEEVTRALAHQIVDWSWTDDFDKPLPRPEDEEKFLTALRWLAPYELDWLQGNIVVGGTSKNSESP